MIEVSNTITLQHICKSFGKGDTKTDVLHDINWTVEPGKMTFLVGPSGCGKTTLISIIAGILSATSGTVNLFDHDLMSMSKRQIVDYRRENIGFIFQQFNLLPALSAAENVCIPLVANNMQREPAIEKANAMLAKVGMAEHSHKLSNQLSGGQQQRIAIARALVHEPRLLLCDEPTASLDAASGQQAMQLLKENAKKAGRCVLIVTHDSRIFPFADTMVRMDDGVIKSVEHDCHYKNSHEDI